MGHGSPADGPVGPSFDSLGGAGTVRSFMSYTDDRAAWFEGQGLWQHVPAEHWQDWVWQLKNRLTTLEDLERFMTLTPEERRGVAFAGKKLALAITPYYFNLIDRDDPNCPIRKQVIPREGEMLVAREEMLDSLGEDEHSPVPGLVHRYPDRVLFLVTDRCAAYCRYCTRSRLVSNAQDYNFHPEYEQGLRYIESHPEVRDVLLSGGDPLLLSDRKLEHLLSRLRAIPHVEFIRIGTRIPVFLPQRITPELGEVFKRHGPIWMSIHVNHPNEATAELRDACTRLSFAGVPLGNQSVLLKGVNDDPEVMRALVHRLLRMRVRPYYLYQMDLITGGSHFKVDVRKGLEIIESLRGHTTGYAIPQYVIDAPGGGGKVPVNPEYVESITDEAVVFRNYEGRTFRYPLTSTGLTPATEDGVPPEHEPVRVAHDFS
jgi:lysine 2,3-aminomutase